MSEATKAILDQVFSLPVEDQLHVADSIYESLDPASDSIEKEIAAIESDSLWQAKLNQRLDFVEKHPEQLLDGQDVIAELRKRFA